MSRSYKSHSDFEDNHAHDISAMHHCVDVDINYKREAWFFFSLNFKVDMIC